MKQEVGLTMVIMLIFIYAAGIPSPHEHRMIWYLFITHQLTLIRLSTAYAFICDVISHFNNLYVNYRRGSFNYFVLFVSVDATTNNHQQGTAFDVWG